MARAGGRQDRQRTHQHVTVCRLKGRQNLAEQRHHQLRGANDAVTCSLLPVAEGLQMGFCIGTSSKPSVSCDRSLHTTPTAALPGPLHLCSEVVLLFQHRVQLQINMSPSVSASASAAHGNLESPRHGQHHGRQQDVRGNNVHSMPQQAAGREGNQRRRMQLAEVGTLCVCTLVMQSIHMEE